MNLWTFIPWYNQLQYLEIPTDSLDLNYHLYNLASEEEKTDNINSSY